MNGRERELPLRIAYITVRTPGASSGEEFFLPEIRALIAGGHMLTLVPRESGARAKAIAETELSPIAKVVGLAAPEVLWEFLKSVVRDPALTADIIRECCSGGTWLTTVKNVRVLPKGIWLGHFVRQQSLNHIHAQWGATTATLAQIAHRVSGVPWSLTLHRGDIVENNRLKQKLSSAAFTRFISRSGLTLFKKVTGDDPRTLGDVHVIHMGVAVPPDEELAAPRRAIPFRLICPANLVPVKGHTFLLAAIELLTQRGIDVHLSIAGEGALRPGLENWVRDHGLIDRVTFMGQLTHDALLGTYRNGLFDAVVLASIDMGNGIHEGVPVALMESMAYGLPVVSTQTGGIPELLHDGAGVVVPPMDSVSLAKGIESLITDRQLASETARRGRERVLSEFNAALNMSILSRLFYDSPSAVP